jgi:predicted dehydrogenase
VTLALGIVGCGNIGRAHSLSLKALVAGGAVDARVVAVHDVDPERAAAFARAHGAAAAPSAEAVIEAADAVWICTPTASHRALVAAACARGRAVFCEKPLGRDLEEAAAIAGLVEAAGVPAQVGLVLRSAPVFAALRDLVRSGELGPVMAVVFRDDQYFPIQGTYASTWRADATVAGSGTLLEHSIHDLDICRWCFGEVAWVTGRTANFAGHPGIEDVAVATLACEAGCTVSLTSVWHQVLSRPSLRRVEVFCERGMVWLDDDRTGPLHVETTAGTEVLACPGPTWLDELPWLGDPRVAVVREYAVANRAFVEAVAAGRTPEPGFGEALAAHRLADAVYRSAAAGGAPVPTRC